MKKKYMIPVNILLWVLNFAICGMKPDTLLGCLLISALLLLSIIDWECYEIPPEINLFIMALGVIRLLLQREQWLLHLAGFFCISTILLLVYLITKGRAVGGGDIKLMAAAGLFLGWELVTVAFLSGGIYAGVIHIIRMIAGKKEKEIALGPYLSGGIVTALWFGESLVRWCIN